MYAESVWDIWKDSNKCDGQISYLHNRLIQDQLLSFKERIELEIELYELRLRKSKLRLSYYKLKEWIRKQKKIANSEIAKGVRL